MCQDTIIAELGDLVFLRKRAGEPVFPPHAQPDGDCLLARWLALRPGLAEIGWPVGFEGGIAHRLDSSTSGIVVACTSVESLRDLRLEFGAGTLRKVYRLVSTKQVPWSRHEVRVPIAHDRRRRARMVVQRGGNTPHRGRWYPASTALERLGTGCWRAVIHTGVTHQIRVHAAFAGIALAGDRLYGGGGLPEGVQPPAGASFMLHHERIVGPDWSSPELEIPGWWGRYGSGSSS